MTRILTGIQSTGVPHLGNLLGAILPGIELSRQSGNEAFFFIANLHSLTTIHDPKLIRENTRATAAAWLACGFDTADGYFYRQSDIPEVTELTWYLTCYFKYNRLKLAHSFKDKAEKLGEEKISAGLFLYPMLMAADILLYDAEIVPVGKDQKQHIEYTRDVAQKINHQHGADTLVLPEAQIDDNVKTIIGTTKDEAGNFLKMSKSYGNTINIFETDKKLRKTIMRIQTDSAEPHEPKDPEQNIVYQLYKHVANEAQLGEMREGLEKGGPGYGTIKQWLYEAIAEKFGDAREKFAALMNEPEDIEAALAEGANKARKVASETLDRVRDRLGY